MSSAIRFQDVAVPSGSAGGARPLSFEVAEAGVSAVVAAPAAADAIVRLCIGALRAEEGRVEVLGRDPGSLNRLARLRFRRSMGVSFRRRGLVGNLSLRDNLVVPLVFAGVCSADEARRRADEAIEALELGDWADARPDGMPRGVGTMADIARATLSRPELLILGSSATALTVKDARKVRDWCRPVCSTIFILLPDRSRPMADLADRWLALDEPGAGGAPASLQD